MKVARVLGVFLLVAALFVFVPLAEANSTISVTNRTGVEIYYMYVSSSGTSDWEEDVLGDDTLPNGQTLRIRVTGRYNQFDLRVEDSDGDSLEFYEFPGNTTQITIFGNGTVEYR